MNRNALLLGAWLGYTPGISAALILAYTVQVYFYYLDVGDAISIGAAIGIAAVDIALWLLLSPAIVALYVELAAKSRTMIHVLVQLPAAFAFAIVHILLDGLVNILGFGPFVGSYVEFLQIFLTSKLFGQIFFYVIIVLSCTALDYKIRLAGLSVRFESRDQKRDELMVHDGHRRIRVPLAEILWFESANNYVGVHSLGGTQITRDTLTHLNELLHNDGFARVHRSAIVNLQHVRNWQPLHHGDGELTLSDGTTVRVSRRYRDTMQNWRDNR